MSNPGLTPEWASIILDSHQKNFADECAICFSEIAHDFRVAELAVKADDHDDVASAGTAESDEFARPTTFVAQPGGLQDPADLNGKLGACDHDTPAPLGNTSAAHSSYFEMLQPGPGTASPADSCGTPRIESAGPSRRAPPLNAGSSAGNAGDGVLADDGTVADAESMVQLEDGRSPDALAEDIMSQPSNHCSKEQLELLYKTCRCAPGLLLCGAQPVLRVTTFNVTRPAAMYSALSSPSQQRGCTPGAFACVPAHGTLVNTLHCCALMFD